MGDFISKYILLKEKRIINTNIYIFVKPYIFMKLKFTKEIIGKIKDEANLIVFNSKMCTLENLKAINEIVDSLKDLNITIPYNI